MELDRAHRSTTPGKLFVCFTSRLSHSSSMRFSSKSILSPCRSDKPSVSLSHSLSRRLRTSGSVKGCGGQSPMFLSAFGKKRGCAFENAEPSSPKVTCIGQVRVKTKKQGKKMRILRACRSREGHGDGTGEVSFRKMGHNRERLTHQNSQSLYQGCLRHRNQRWVHLPLTICEALRAFGTEFSCFVPCKSSCFSNGVRETGGKATGSNGLGARGDDSSSCGGTVFRWFVALHEGGGKTRNLELVVGGEEEEPAVVERESSRRRSIFYDKEFEDEFCGVENAEDDPGVGICIPPKNALLLMRCRSDPMRMAALANKFWDSPLAEDDAEEEEEEEEEEVEATEECVNEDEEKGEAMQVRDELEKGCEKIDEICDDWVLYKAIVEGQEVGEDLGNSAEDEEQEEQLRNEAMKDQSSECRELQQVKDSEKQDAERSNQLIEAGIESNWCSVEPTEKLEDESNEYTLMKDHLQNQDDELEETPKLSNQFSSEENHEEDAQQEEGAATEQVLETEIILLGNEGGQEQSIQERENQENSSEDDEMPVTQRNSAESQTTQEQTEAEKPMEDRETEADEEEEQETVKKKPPMSKKKQQQQERESSVLPDCLLLMISEPKLSMEVSKETWVCSTDFIRLLPERHHHHHHKLVNQKNGCDEQQKTVVAYSNPPPVNTIAPPPQAVFQPPRSSCSFPIVSTNGGVSMASLIEQKLVGAVAYEPFVLTRCKSEPMKSSANFAPPELACFWKSRKLEPHRPANFGVGAAGVGF